MIALMLLLAAQTAPESMLPSDAVLYAAIENVPRDLDWAKAILKAHCRDGEDEKLFGWLMESYEGGADEDLRRVLGPLMTIRSLHVAVREVSTPTTTQVIVVAVSEAPDELEMLIPEGTPAEKRGDATVYALKRPAPMHVAFHGTFVIAATHLELIDAALKGEGSGLKLPGERRDAPSLRGFVKVGEMLRQARATMSRRERYELDAFDAVYGFSAIGGARIDARIEGGRAFARVEADVAGECAVWNLVHMAPGDLSSLGFVPNDALYAASVALQEMPAWLGRLKRSVDETGRNTSGEEEAAWDEFASQVKRFFNIDLDAAAAAFGPNLAHFAWIDAEKSGLFVRRGVGSVFVMKIEKPDAVAAILEGLPDGQAFSTGLVVDDFEGVTVTSAESEFPLAYAVMDDHLILSVGLDPLKRTISARRKGESMASPSEARSKTAILNVRELCRVLTEQGFPAEVAAALRPDALEIATIAESDRGLTLEVEGPGVGVGAVVGLLAAGLDEVMSGRRYAEWELPPPPSDPLFKPEEGFAVPEDAGERDALIDRCLAKLGAEVIEEREAATTRLWQIGAPAVEKMAAAYRATEDPEVQARIEKVLIALRAYKALPSLLSLRVRQFVEQVQAEGLVYVQWDNPATPSPWAVEPYIYTRDLDAAFVSDPEVQAALLALGKDDPDMDRRRIIAALLATVDSGTMATALLERIPSESDPPTQGLMRCALGWGAADAKVRAEIVRGLSDGDLGVRRASFVAAERAPHSEIVDALLARLAADDRETRFNAAYVLGRLTGGALDLNGFAVDAKRRAEAEAWWSANRDSFGR